MNPKYAKYIPHEDQQIIDPTAKAKIAVAGTVATALYSNVKSKLKKYKILSDTNGVVNLSLAATDLPLEDMWLEITDTIILDASPHVVMHVAEAHNPGYMSDEFEFTNIPNVYYFTHNRDTKYKLILRSAQDVQLSFSHNQIAQRVALIITSPLLLKFQ